MSAVLYEVLIPKRSGLPEDVVVNTWVFSTAAIGDAFGPLVDFYNNDYGGSGVHVASWFSGCVDDGTNRAIIRAYDIDGFLDGSPHGSPDATAEFTLDVGGPTTGLPNEDAVVLSYHALLTDIPEEVGDTRPRARRRGRVYLGPWANTAVDPDSATAEPRVNNLLVDTIGRAADALLAETSVEWCVWSRTDAVIRAVTGGFIDNAFDTVRSRGNEATDRYIF